MPKQTNALQKAIKIVEEYKGDFLELTESAMLQDRITGIDREVDILLEGTINGHTIKVAIEVIDRKRPASTPWVESMQSKHNSLPTDKLILVSSSGFYKPALEKANFYGAIPIDTSKGDKQFRAMLENAAYIRGLRVQAIVFLDEIPINLTSKLQIGDHIATVEEQIHVLLNNQNFKEVILDPRKKHEPGFVAEITSSFIIDGKVSRKGQILKFVIFSDLISDIPINLSTMHYQGVDYVYGKVGNNSHYFVMDMDGELVGHEKKT